MGIHGAGMCSCVRMVCVHVFVSANCLFAVGRLVGRPPNLRGTPTRPNFPFYIVSGPLHVSGIANGKNNGQAYFVAAQYVCCMFPVGIVSQFSSHLSESGYSQKRIYLPRVMVVNGPL